MKPERIRIHDHVDNNSGGKLAASASATGAAASSSSGGSSSGGSGITLQEDAVDVANGLVAISVNHALDATAAGGIAVDESEFTYGGTGDMTAEAIASTVSAGAVGKPSDAGHRHAMPSAGTPSGGYGSAAAGSAATLLRSDAVLAKPTAVDVDFSADVTNNNVTSGHHGLAPKNDGNAAHYLDGSGSYSTPGVSASGLSSGTSMPVSPATNDMFFRTDKGIIFFYNGTRWLCTCPHFAKMGAADATFAYTVTQQFGRFTTKDTFGFDLWLVSFETATFVNGTTNSTNFWTITLDKYTAANAATTIVSFDTKTDGASTWVARTTAIGASLAVGTHLETQVGCTKTLSPSGLYIAGTLTYQLIGV